ncbi:MAG: hypothetical protein E5Y76_09605, partial [Mesorhizobium sp.]
MLGLQLVRRAPNSASDPRAAVRTNPRAGRWSGLSKMERGIHRSPIAARNSAASAADFATAQASSRR